jgi:hypothetical protein
MNSKHIIAIGERESKNKIDEAFAPNRLSNNPAIRSEGR